MSSRSPNTIVVIVLVGSLVVGATMFYFSYSRANSLLVADYTEIVNAIGKSRAKQVELFLDGKRNRIIDFSSDGFIKDSLYSIARDEDRPRMMGKLNRHLTVNKLPVDKDFYKVLALGINGVVVAATDTASVGLDFAGDPVFLEGRYRPYIKSLAYDSTSNVKSITLSAPVVQEGEFVGVIVIKMLPDMLMGIMAQKEDFGNNLESYIINREGYLVTPSMYLGGENKGILTQMVNSENARRCFRGVGEIVSDGAFHIEESEEQVFLSDFRGENTIGDHRIIPDTNWCVLTELDYSAIQDRKWEGMKIAGLLVIATAGIVLATRSFLAKRLSDSSTRRTYDV